MSTESPSPGYDNCDQLLNSTPSSVFAIQKSGVDVNKLVIGKPGTTADITNGGFIDPATLGTCIQTAVAGGWKAGVMAFSGAYHGLGYGALGVTGLPAFREAFRSQLRDFATLLPYPACYRCPFEERGAYRLERKLLLSLDCERAATVDGPE